MTTAKTMLQQRGYQKPEAWRTGPNYDVLVIAPVEGSLLHQHLAEEVAEAHASGLYSRVEVRQPPPTGRPPLRLV